MKQGSRRMRQIIPRPEVDRDTLIYHREVLRRKVKEASKIASDLKQGIVRWLTKLEAML